jgi:hypothetical protein
MNVEQNLRILLNTFSRATYGNLCLSEAYSIIGTKLSFDITCLGQSVLGLASFVSATLFQAA